MAIDFMTALRSRARAQERNARLSGRPQTQVEASAPYVAMAETASDRFARGKAIELQENAQDIQQGQFGENLAFQKETQAQNARFESERLAAQREMEAARLAETQRQTNLQLEAAKKARKQDMIQTGVSAVGEGAMLYKLFAKSAAEKAAETAAAEAAKKAAADAAVKAGAYEAAGTAGGATAGSVAGGIAGGVSTAMPYYAAAKAGGMLVEGIDSEGTTFSTFGESLDKPLNVERTWLQSEGIDEPIINNTLDLLNPLGWLERKVGGTVLCTELHRQGKMSDEVYEADSKYGRTIDPEVIAGYHAWAVPLAAWMRESKVVTAIMEPFIKAWAFEAAHKMGAIDKGSGFGRCIAFIGMPLCKMIGKISKRRFICYG